VSSCETDWIVKPTKSSNASLEFEALALSEDDQLPTPIQLVMAYRGVMSAERCEEAFLRGLTCFPHLTGKLSYGLAGRLDQIVPCEDSFSLEVTEREDVWDCQDLALFSLERLSHDFVPLQGESLFQARLTVFPYAGFSVLGLRVSHAAVDGTGLACFINNSTAALRGCEPLLVFHERKYGFGSCGEGGSVEIPVGYREAGTLVMAGDAEDFIPTYFVISVAGVRSFFGASSVLAARLRLAAWLSAGVAQRDESYTSLVLWCDARGTNEIPPTYTGNVGCYLSFPLCGMGAEALAQEMKKIATRRGFERIAATYRAIKGAEAVGRPLLWEGKGMLQVNLVPHAVGGTDFGHGVPAFALLLSRNSSGLRISLTPDASRFLVECCLPNGLGDALVEQCQLAGLAPSVWCGEENALDGACS
jgi:hypothetical protein